MKLAIGFILYNEFSAKYLPFFLPSLLAALNFLPESDYQIYAFDNSSADNQENNQSLKIFENDYFGQTGSGRLKYLSQGENCGYSHAYNIMFNEAAKAGAQYFLTLNPDTLLEPNMIKELLSRLEVDSSLASVAPKIRRWDFTNNIKTSFIDSAGIILLPGLKFIDLGQGQADKGQFDGSDILGPSGAAGVFRLKALMNVVEKNLSLNVPECFDERFFMYKEDCDLAYRLFLAGYKSALVPGALLYHDRTAASSGPGFWRLISDRHLKSSKIRAWSFRNQHLIFIKHWKSQSFVNRCLVIAEVLKMFIFALILEQFLLKEYYFILFRSRGLTNIK